MSSLDVLDKLQTEAIKEEKKSSTKKFKYNFDKLKIYFGEDYEVKGIKISMPTIGDILRIGENVFYQALAPFLYNSTSIRAALWDLNIDWNDVRDIEVFGFLIKNVKNTEPLSLIFKDVDFTDFIVTSAKRQIEDENYELALYSESQGILLYEGEYMEIAEYIREILNVHPKVEKAKGKTTKKWMIQEDKMNIAQLENKNENNSTLLPLVSACINHPGFKYKLEELREMGLYQFMDSVKRIQIYESSIALTHGSYSGFCDLSKIDKKQFDFMRQIDD